MSPLLVVLLSLLPAACLVAWITHLEVLRIRHERAARRAAAKAIHPETRAQLLAALAEARPAVAQGREAWAPPTQRHPDHDEDGAL